MSHGWHRQAGFIARCAMTTPKITLLFVERFCRAEPGGWAGSGHRARTGRAPSPPSITLGPRAPLALHFCGAYVASHLGAICITWANAVGIGRLGARALSPQRCGWEVRRHSPGQAAGLEGHPALIYAHRAHSDWEDESPPSRGQLGDTELKLEVWGHEGVQRWEDAVLGKQTRLLLAARISCSSR